MHIVHGRVHGIVLQKITRDSTRDSTREKYNFVGSFPIEPDYHKRLEILELAMALSSIASICISGHIMIGEHMLIEIVGLSTYQVLSHASPEVNMI